MKKKDTIIGVAFLVWFFASIGGMLYVIKIGQIWLFPAFFGQYFLVFGILGINSFVQEGKFGYDALWSLLFPLVGIVCIAASFVWHFGSEELWEKCMEYIPYAGLGLFVLAGLYMMGMWIRSRFLLEKICSQRVEAKCIEVLNNIESRNGSRTTTYCPVYQFYYNGNMYDVCNNVYTNLFCPEVNTVYEIFINPTNPTQFYEPTGNKRTGIIMLILGICFIVFPIFGMVMYSIY